MYQRRVSKTQAPNITRSDDKKVQVLHLNVSGADERSYTNIAAISFFKKYRSLHPNHDIEEVSLWDKDLLQFNLSHVACKMRMDEGMADKKDEEKFAPVQKMILRLRKADKLVISCPMWNHSIPYVLKQYIDCIVQPGLTFTEDEDGNPLGLITGRPLLLVTASGGDYTVEPLIKLDYQVPYLKDIFALIGYNDLRHIYIKSTAKLEREEILNFIDERTTEEVSKF